MGVEGIALWFGGLGLSVGISAVGGWTNSLGAITCERKVFHGKKVVGDYPTLEKFAPSSEKLCWCDDTKVCLCDGIGIAIASGMFYAVGTLTQSWFPATQYLTFALQRATVQCIGVGSVFRSCPGMLTSFLAVWYLEWALPNTALWPSVFKAICAAFSFQAGFDLWDITRAIVCPAQVPLIEEDD